MVGGGGGTEGKKEGEVLGETRARGRREKRGGLATRLARQAGANQCISTRPWLPNYVHYASDRAGRPSGASCGAHGRARGESTHPDANSSLLVPHFLAHLARRGGGRHLDSRPDRGQQAGPAGGVGRAGGLGIVGCGSGERGAERGLGERIRDCVTAAGPGARARCKLGPHSPTGVLLSSRELTRRSPRRAEREDRAEADIAGGFERGDEKRQRRSGRSGRGARPSFFVCFTRRLQLHTHTRPHHHHHARPHPSHARRVPTHGRPLRPPGPRRPGDRPRARAVWLGRIGRGQRAAGGAVGRPAGGPQAAQDRHLAQGRTGAG